MYVPSHFVESRPEVLHVLMDQHPLATLIAVTAGGLEANHVPVIFEPHGGGVGTLKGHIARANTLWRDLKAGAEVLTVFQGASRYISPNWYPSKLESGQVVPTWNYAVVHARGRITWMHDAQWLRGFLESLTDRHERGSVNPWRMDDAPANYIDKMLGAIVGFEIALDKLTGKWKLSQNRSAQDRAGVVAALTAFPDDESRRMAGLVENPGRGTGN